ncbi:MAG: 50S ribosomal protein L6 [Anaerolineales bacterium]|nr:50S ribosomal protein L6 [Anaerolineales bacterium]MCB8938022.1 50S ribosomal protein L6 [Ardenticatenaceae bacterium]
MSRIGKAPITIPNGVQIEVKKGTINVKGPKGQLTQKVHPDMQFEQEDGVLTVKRPSDSRQHRSLHGLTRALISNMVVGVSDGFNRILDIEGVGYRAELDGTTLVLNVGYSHPVRFEPPKDVSFVVENRNKTIIVNGIDKQVVGEISAVIRKQRPPEPYKGKGIRYRGEYVRRKAGKAGKV